MGKRPVRSWLPIICPAWGALPAPVSWWGFLRDSQPRQQEFGCFLPPYHLCAAEEPEQSRHRQLEASGPRLVNEQILGGTRGWGPLRSWLPPAPASQPALGSVAGRWTRYRRSWDSRHRFSRRGCVPWLLPSAYQWLKSQVEGGYVRLAPFDRLPTPGVRL